jgi:flagellin
MSSGLSIANNLLANNVSLNLNKNQAALQTSVTRLSSGLRINSAADDPSGLAIAEKLQAQVNGFDQATQNVQDATNAATVADGALQTTTDILQRIRSLAVEASSDITSSDDKINLQAEVTQLLLEVNRISQNTNFNGSSLLDGSHAGFTPEENAFATVTSNAALASNGGALITNGVNAGLLAASVVGVVPGPIDFFNTTPPNPNGTGLTGVQGIGSGQLTVDGTLELQVINTGVSIAVRESFFESASGLATVSTTLFAANGTITANLAVNSAVGFDNVAITLGNFSTADVGVTSYIKVSQNVPAASNPNTPAFNFQSGAAEGSTIQVGFQATNTNTLRISNINLLLSSSSAPSLGAEDAIGQIDNALERLLNQRSQLGAVIVRLNEDADNNNVAAVNLQASESQIRDLNVGQETTNFTRLQILVQVGTSVLSQSNSNAQSVLGLFR